MRPAEVTEATRGGLPQTAIRLDGKAGTFAGEGVPQRSRLWRKGGPCSRSASRRGARSAPVDQLLDAAL